jgi:selenocysteine lyase/cysteine desulfurase
MEHNAVMRPLRSLEKQGVRLSIIPCSTNGSIDVRDIGRALTPGTKLIVMTHASNVVGTLLPVNEIATIAHQAGTLLLVDAAQAAGVIPIDMRASGIDLLAFTGHKELQSPPGIGGLVINNDVNVSQFEPLICGGTGSRSESEEQPENLPDKFESGTANLVGIAGLGAGLKWIMDRGIPEIRDNMKKLRRTLIDGLYSLPGVITYGTTDTDLSVAIVSFKIDGKHVSEIGLILDEEYGILSRVGLHCAPAAHKTIGSFPEGTARLSPGVFTTVSEVQETVQAIRKIVKS